MYERNLNRIRGCKGAGIYPGCISPNVIKYSKHKYILVKNIILWLILINSKLNIKMVCVLEELFRLEGFCYIGFLKAASLYYLYLVEGLEPLKTD